MKRAYSDTHGEIITRGRATLKRVPAVDHHRGGTVLWFRRDYEAVRWRRIHRWKAARLEREYRRTVDPSPVGQDAPGAQVRAT